MYPYSASSMKRLLTAHRLQQKLWMRVAETENCTIIFGHRPKEEQFELYKKGRAYDGYEWYVVNKDEVVTNCDGYKIASYHNHEDEDGNPCSLAIDAGPYINGKLSYDRGDCIYFAGRVMLHAELMGIPVVWGGDWDGDKDTSDNTLNDWVHFQLKGVL